MKIGFTGNRHGMTENQKKQFNELIISLGGSEFHHGDCVGSDAEAHDMAFEQKLRIVIHPPTANKHRAHKNGDEHRPAMTYLARNKEIVKASDVMIASPSSLIPAQRSGTWSTIRFAQKSGKQIHILHP